jgi:alpha-glucan phosphorylase-like protein
MENPVQLRNITDRLYGSEPGKRISQEWLLSMGGFELTKKLEMPIKIFHMNEGHTAFLVLARILDLVESKTLSFEEAFYFVRFSTIFTTHTPVAAGHDEFPLDEALRLIRKRVSDPEIVNKFIALGASLKGVGSENCFSMTGLAFRGSRWVNAVSQIHQGVSQQMFNNLYPDLERKEVPVSYVTNGVHVPSWVTPEWQSLFYEKLGDDWTNQLANVDFWKKLETVPLEEIATIKQKLKDRLIQWIRKRLGEELAQGAYRPEYSEVLARLDSRTLIISHAKRMAPYKRADLLFQDPEKLHELIKKSPVPILFLYAGKAHPSDGMGQEILQRISSLSRDPRFIGHVLLLEDYDLSFARRLLAGSDVWLNTPLRPLEASGTSGMKAAMNGTLHFSIADGWWPEAYNGKNGWMIGDGSEIWDRKLQDDFDRSRILHVLEHEILREYTDVGESGFSKSWTERIRHSVSSILPVMSSERMFSDYQSRLYDPAIKASEQLKKDRYAELRRFVVFKSTIRDHWDKLSFDTANLDEFGGESISRNQNTEAIIGLVHPGLTSSHLQVQAILGQRVSNLHSHEYKIIPLECVSKSNVQDQSQWRLRLENAHSGEYSLAIRVIPKCYPGVEDASFELKLVKWM